MITLSPAPDYRHALKRGMRGTDVAALQINVPLLTTDGVFGKETKRAVEMIQARHGLGEDGIAGPDTFRKIFMEFAREAEDYYRLPERMLKSIGQNESLYNPAAFAWHPSDSGFDLGGFQKSITPAQVGNQNAYQHAYSLNEMAGETAGEIRAARGALESPVDSWYFDALAKGNRSRFRWMLAVLNHNWPYAAFNICRTGHIFLNPAGDTAYAGWVDEATKGRILTPREWVVSYVQRATVYIWN